MIDESAAQATVANAGRIGMRDRQSFRPIPSDNGLETIGDIIHRLVPGDAVPITLPSGTRTLHWVEKSVGMGEGLRSEGTFHAKHIFEEWMIARRNFDDTAIFDLCGHGAKTIAGRTNNRFHRCILSGFRFHPIKHW